MSILNGNIPQNLGTAQSPNPVLTGTSGGIQPGGSINYTNAYIPSTGSLFAPINAAPTIPNPGLSTGGSTNYNNPLASNNPTSNYINIGAAGGVGNGYTFGSTGSTPLPSGAPTALSGNYNPVINTAGGPGYNGTSTTPTTPGAIPPMPTDPAQLSAWLSKYASSTNGAPSVLAGGATGTTPNTAPGTGGNGAATTPPAAGYYSQPLSHVISGTGNENAPTFQTTYNQWLAGLKAESPGAIQGDINASTQSGGGPNGQQPAGYASWTPAAQQAYSYATLHPDDPEINAAGGLQAFVNQYNDPSKYSYQALTGYTPAQLAAAPTGTTYGNTPSYAGQSPTTGPGPAVQLQPGQTPAVPWGPSTPQVGPTPTTGTAQNTAPTNPAVNSTPAVNTNQNPLAALGITDAQYQQLISATQNTVGTTPLGYTQYQAPAVTAGGLNAQEMQAFAALIASLGNQNQNTQQVPYWYL